ncbi:hypothetical protein N7447_007794 [Penicillium robsamsonii]|uniref:uncharacterized protein n=1 Tax=Penicillium robsamsonii TaxID=1792511 RepID=UPI0025474141|nr:uncharacterized protein N7447_007794 [Penicillium robsamsonii]KAJ5817786.1 hypothetical protein N7447_007794 [Penicillium robsamsonii]
MTRGWLALCLPLLLLFSFYSLGIAAPVEFVRRADGEDSKPSLRILPLGASITWGLLSPTGNGYRKHLRDQLRFDGWNVDMVGSRSNGDMEDDDVEARSGDVITQVETAAAKSVGYKPNVVIINAGTNDCRQGVDIPNTGTRMEHMIKNLVGSEDMNDTLIVLSTLIPSTQKLVAAHRDEVNKQYRDLVKSMQQNGVNIVLADMDPPAPNVANGWISWPEDFTSENGAVDDTHPNDRGYAKMAYVWYRAIDDAYANDLISEPVDTGSSSGGKTCEKTPGNGIYAGGLTQKGSGEDDGIYYHSSESMGVVYSLYGEKDFSEKIFFARLYDQERDDILVWHESENTVQYQVYKNNGGSKLFDSPILVSVKDNCIPRGVHFIDINGDGLDDFVCIGTDGTAYASVNNGDGSSTKAPTFTSLGKWKDSEGDQENVRLGDVDGDGRADYCIVASNGDITCWRNGWIDDLPAYWQPLGKRFINKEMGDIKGVRFEDINGDGRDDWIWVDDDGATTTYTNSRSCAKGKEGDGLNVVWRQGFQKGQTSGPTHSGMGGISESSLREQIHFARIYGERQDFGLLGRQDYVFVERGEFVDENLGFSWDFHVWKNVGSGATKIKADGNRYCNMMGHDDGRMDYVWILSKGDMRIYPNKGLINLSDSSPSYWDASYVMFDPSKLSIDKNLDRRDLHLVDWDGDGACDIVWTDPTNENQPHLWRNRIKDTGDFNWAYTADPAPQVRCSEKRGLGFFDRPVHLADISGNGKSDYLCVEKDGRVSGYVHTNDGWGYIDQIKSAEDKDRPNLQWADVNGDGRADMLHTNKFNGDGTVWYNRGRRDIGGSKYWWENSGVKYQGTVEGSCTYFPDLNGDGFADMHAITHSINNTAETWYNDCSGKNHFGDDGPIEDPNLPIIPQ